jgi:L-ascorbate metabolism protein UlaG (beta-lactamase superfamily)
MLPSQITYIGHATMLIEIEGYRLLTDPLLRNRVAHLRRQVPILAGDWAKNLDAILISHLHLDHFDLPSLRRLARHTRLLVPQGAAQLLHRQGFTEVEALAPGDTAHIGTLPVTATAALHSGFRPPMGPTITALGYLIGARRRIYFPGDTDLFPTMADYSDDLDTALMPVWGWGPTLGPGHLNPERAAEALKLLRPRLAVPIHWGTLSPLGVRTHRAPFLSDPPHHFAEHAARLAPEVRVEIVQPGQSLWLPPATRFDISPQRHSDTEGRREGTVERGEEEG